jgi:hypothetical protein
MRTTVDQITDRIYRLSTWIPDVGPGGFTFNQFLVDAEEPLLYHTGMRQLFPLVSGAVERVMPVRFEFEVIQAPYLVAHGWSEYLPVLTLSSRCWAYVLPATERRRLTARRTSRP